MLTRARIESFRSLVDVTIDLAHRPDPTVFLLDGDQDATRLSKTREHTRETTRAALPCVVGVAEPELEAWLLADPAAVRQVLGVDFDGTRRSKEER